MRAVLRGPTALHVSSGLRLLFAHRAVYLDGWKTHVAWLDCCRSEQRHHHGDWPAHRTVGFYSRQYFLHGHLCLQYLELAQLATDSRGVAKHHAVW